MRRALPLVVLGACVSPTLQDYPSRWFVPPPARAEEPALPAVEMFDVDGIPVALVENHRLPLATIAIVHRAAGSREAPPGIAALAADTITADVARDGATFESEATTDAAITTLHAATSDPAALDDAVRRMGDALAHPADHVATRERRLADIAAHQRRPRTLAAQAFDRIAFGPASYSKPAEGDETLADTSDVTRSDGWILTFRARAYGPRAASIAVAGDLTRAQVTTLLHTALAGWTGDATFPTRVEPMVPYEPLREPVGLPDGVTASDAIVLVGARSLPPRDQLAAAEVENAVFGGGRGSRADQRLRVELHLAPSVSSSFWRGAWSGTWALAASVPHARATEAVSAIVELVDDARATEPTADELARAKAQLGRQIAQQFDTADTTVRTLVSLVAQGRPADDSARFLHEVFAVTPAQARDAAQSFGPLSVVVVGP